MRVTATAITDVLILEPQVFSDERGFFMESFSHKKFIEATGIESTFVQDNYSRSGKHVLRGLHYQIEQTQGKLVFVGAGSVYDVVVDLRRSSSSFGQWVGVELSEQNHRQLWVPPGFAHGFIVLSETVDVIYKTTDYYAPGYERCILWNDPDIGIDWPNKTKPILSAKDQQGVLFKDAEYFS